MSTTTFITVTLSLSKETKNTYRYDATDGEAPVSNLYVRKEALGNAAPAKLVVQITPQ